MAVEDIMIGPVRIFSADLGTALPDESTVGYGDDWPVGWTELGFTEEGTPLSMNQERELHEASAQQVTGPLKRRVTSERVTLETTVIEINSSNWLLAYGGTKTTTPAGVGQVGFDEIKKGSDFFVEEKMWAFEGMRVDANGNKLPLRMFLHKATAVVGGALQFGKATTSGIALRVEALQDPSQAPGEEFYVVHIVTAPATS